jgi:dTDP-4-dehydrorhamnose 3,5-epimerase
MTELIIKKLAKFDDDRGWLTEIFRNDEIDYVPAMAYVSLTKPGVIRGPHEHHEQADCFVFVGPGNFELHLWDRRPNSSKLDEHQILEVGEENPTLVVVPPGVVHGYKCVSEIAAYSINLPDKLYRGNNKLLEIDEIRHEQDSASPYKIL